MAKTRYRLDETNPTYVLDVQTSIQMSSCELPRYFHTDPPFSGTKDNREFADEH